MDKQEKHKSLIAELQTRDREKRVVYDNSFAECHWMKFIPKSHVGLDNFLFSSF